MVYYFVPSLFSLTVCLVLVWAGAQRMRSGRSYMLLCWLARFFGIMAMFGVFNVLEKEGIRAGWLIAVAGAFVMYWVVPWLVRLLGRRGLCEDTGCISEESGAAVEKATSGRVWVKYAMMILIGAAAGVATHSHSYKFKAIHLERGGGLFFGIYFGISFWFAFVVVRDCLRRAFREYEAEDPNKALSYAAMAILCLVLWGGLTVGVFCLVGGLVR